jgi:dihydrofolate reductase
MIALMTRRLTQSAIYQMLPQPMSSAPVRRLYDHEIRSRTGNGGAVVRKLILKMSMSIDGFVGGPNGEIDWLFPTMDEAATAWTVGIIQQAGVHIMGSRTFRDMAAYWPSSTEPFAAPMNEIPKAYFSRSGSAGSTTRALADASARTGSPPPAAVGAAESWNTARAVTGDLTEEIAGLKKEPGNDILAHGGAAFARSLVKLGLIDEYQLLTHPVALGQGLPLFADLPSRLDLKLVDATAFKSGAVAHVYRPE